MTTLRAARTRLSKIDLPPDVFAVVMATGIVSIAATYRPYPALSRALAGIAAALFVLLGGGLILRILAGPRSALGQVTDPDVALRLFTSVAACAVLGARFAAERWALWLFAIAALGAWLLLVPLAARDVASRPRAQLRDHAHGAWLLPSVATFGLASIAAALAVRIDSPALLLAGVALAIGALATYASVTWLIAWRAIARPFVPELITPDSWILMGALAIGTLTGAHLLAAARALHMSGVVPGALHEATLVGWALASGWIPFLLYAEMWRIDQRAGSLHYAGVWWSAVFPVAMYSTATAATGSVLRIRPLGTIALVTFWVAVTLWLLVGTGLIHQAVLHSRRTKGVLSSTR